MRFKPLYKLALAGVLLVAIFQPAGAIAAACIHPNCILVQCDAYDNCICLEYGPETSVNN